MSPCLLKLVVVIENGDGGGFSFAVSVVDVLAVVVAHVTSFFLLLQTLKTSNSALQVVLSVEIQVPFSQDTKLRQIKSQRNKNKKYKVEGGCA